MILAKELAKIFRVNTCDWNMGKDTEYEKDNCSINNLLANFRSSKSLYQGLKNFVHETVDSTLPPAFSIFSFALFVAGTNTVRATVTSPSPNILTAVSPVVKR